MKGLCVLAVIPMRKDPSDRSEMVNQILYGETFDILEKQEKWSHIKLHHDNYVGWIDNKQYKHFSGSKLSKPVPVSKLYSNFTIENQKLILPMGAFYNSLREDGTLAKSIVNTAKQFLNTPYLWGGRTFMGIDCSGFTQIVFRLHGIKIRRDAAQQEKQGKKIKYEESSSNDLAFFSNADGRVIHVGIIILHKGQTLIIHASGKVRIDLLDKQGIFNEETNAYSHFLYSVKRFA